MGRAIFFVVLAFSLVWPQSLLIAQAGWECCAPWLANSGSTSSPHHSPRLSSFASEPSEANPSSPLVARHGWLDQSPHYASATHSSHSESHTDDHSDHQGGLTLNDPPIEMGQVSPVDHFSAVAATTLDEAASETADSTPFDSTQSSCGLAQCPGYQAAAFIAFVSPEVPRPSTVFSRPTAPLLALAPDLKGLFRPPRL